MCTDFTLYWFLFNRFSQDVGTNGRRIQAAISIIKRLIGSLDQYCSYESISDGILRRCILLLENGFKTRKLFLSDRPHLNHGYSHLQSTSPSLMYYSFSSHPSIIMIRPTIYIYCVCTVVANQNYFTLTCTVA